VLLQFGIIQYPFILIKPCWHTRQTTGAGAVHEEHNKHPFILQVAEKHEPAYKVMPDIH
jgi:hypothetical protein